MSHRHSLILALGLLLFAAMPAAKGENFCMDCLQKQTQVSEVPVKYSSDAICCMFPCAGYESYDMRDEDVGYGCRVDTVDNFLVSGTLCASTNQDKGCPTGGANKTGQQTAGGVDCTYSSQGWCPAECGTCS